MEVDARQIIAALLVNFVVVTYRGEFGCVLAELPPLTSVDPTYGIKRRGFSYVQDGVVIVLEPPSVYAYIARN